MASVVVNGDTSGAVTLSAPAVAGTVTVTLPATSGTMLTTASTTGISGSAISSGTVPEAYGGTGTSTGYYGFKNRIINGAMMIDQRNAGASVTPTSSGQFTIDRWQAGLSVSSKFSVQQSSTAPSGFVKSILVTSLSAYTVGATESFAILQPIEGLNMTDVGFGAASASTLTLSFWVRSSLTGTFGGVLTNYANDRSYPFSYTISSANTFEQKTITITGDTTGTWNTTNTGWGQVWFGLGVGSSKSTTAGSWVAGGYYSATGATSVVGTNGATFYITGVQLEKGSTATSFDYRPYGTELALCQRYAYSLSTPGGSQYFLTPGFFAGATNGFFGFNFPVIMRSTPSLSPTPTAGNYQLYLPNGGTYQTLTAISLNGVTTNNFALLNFTIASGGTAGQGCYLNSQSANSLPIIFSAEL